MLIASLLEQKAQKISDLFAIQWHIYKFTRYLAHLLILCPIYCIGHFRCSYFDGEAV